MTARNVLVFPGEVRLNGLPEAIFDPSKLVALAATGLLDTRPEPEFDNLASLAAAVTGTGRAFITLVDDKRSFWKASVGVDLEAGALREQAVSESLCQLLVEAGRPMMVPDVLADPRTRDHPAVAELGIGAWAGYPITAAGGQVLGGLYVVDDRPRPWSPEQEAALAALARAVANEIELRQLVNVTQATADVAVALARTLQDSFLPPALPQLRGVDLAAAYLPAAGGAALVGDFYDVFHSGGPWWSAVMGDVCGKGVEAAKVTALARYTVRAEATHSLSPATVLRRLNSAMLSHDRDGRFLTALYATFRVTSAGMAGRLCVAGHPPALIRRASGQVTEIGQLGTLLGFVDDLVLHEVGFRLRPGDALLAFTDGAIEARKRREIPGSQVLMGEQTLRRLFADCEGLDAAGTVSRLMEAVSSYTGNWPSDDTAMLVVRVPPT
jgi:serine phosphatase RsbU (regulator of sigma subunit)